MSEAIDDFERRVRQLAQWQKGQQMTGGVYKVGWDPADELPMAQMTDVFGAVRNDEPVAMLVFYDPVAEQRAVHISVNVALQLQRQIAQFLEMAARRP